MNAKEPIEELIQRSSFGTLAVRSLCDRTPDEVARRIAARVHDHLQRPDESTRPQEASPAGRPAAWTEQLASVLGQTELFRELAHDTRRALAARLTPVTLDEGQDVFAEAEPAECMFVLAEGTVRTMRRSGCGDSIEFAHHRAPAIFGELELLTGGVRRTSAQVIEPATLIPIPRDELLNLLQSDHHVATAALRMVSQRVRRAEERRMQSALDWHWRTAGQLVDTLRLVREWSCSLDSSRAGMVGSYARHTPVRRCMLAFDIEGFGRPDRTTRLALRTALRDLLSQSLWSAGIDWTQLELADFGDGGLVLLDPQASNTRPLHPLVLQLAGRLARYNSAVPSAARLRLRLAVHSGEVQRTAHGFAGEDLDLAFRLLSARALRNRLARSPADLALIVSDQVHERAVAHPDHETSLVTCKSVQVRARENTIRAWVYLPVAGGTSRDRDSATSSAPYELCQPR
jgi:CRP-like cAMP-binding protein